MLQAKLLFRCSHGIFDQIMYNYFYQVYTIKFGRSNFGRFHWFLLSYYFRIEFVGWYKYKKTFELLKEGCFLMQLNLKHFWTIESTQNEWNKIICTWSLGRRKLWSGWCVWSGWWKWLMLRIKGGIQWLCGCWCCYRPCLKVNRSNPLSVWTIQCRQNRESYIIYSCLPGP